MSIDNTDFEGPVTITDASSEQPDAPTLPKGTLVSRYIVADLIGRGGMGVVYKAFDPELTRPVALKLITVQRRSSENSQDFSQNKARALREAQALAQLSHPNVVTVHDVGMFQDQVFMALEYVEGKTLKDVIEEHKISRKELLQILIAAGRGLCAAHKAGLVHRDFKPSNVILGKDGRVRVIDFGLARAEVRDAGPVGGKSIDELEKRAAEIGNTGPARNAGLAAGSTPGGYISSPMTLEGTVVGTPQYMSFEQHLGTPADAKSDQFSFCVVLFEALYGQRPFLGRSQRDMVQAMTLGKITEAGKSDVPAWLDRIARRGINKSAQLRYPSMDDLLADLENDPAIARAKNRARWFKVVMLLLVVALSGLAAWGVWYGPTKGARLCRGGEQKLVGVWDDTVKAKIKEAFGKTGRSYEADTFERVSKALDKYTDDWVAMRRESCEATHVRGEQSDKLLDLRMQCLERRLSETRALTELLAAKPDREVVNRAVQAALGLPGIGVCEDKKALLAAVPPPEEPAIARQVEDLRKRLDEVDALARTGKAREGLALATETLAASQQVTYKPVVAECLVRVGSLLDMVGRYAEAEEQLRKATCVADASGHAEIRARALNALIHVVGDRQARFEDAEKIAEAAAAVLEYLGARRESLASWHNGLGGVLFQKGDYDRALTHYQEALKIREATQGAEHPDVAASHNNIGGVFLERGDYGRALEHFQTALAIKEKVLGPAHPAMAYSHDGVGIVQLHLGELDQAELHLIQALRMWEATFGSEYPLLIDPLNGLGWIALRRGKPLEAAATFERILALCARGNCLGDEREPFAQAQFGLACALWDTGRGRVQALKLGQEARAALRVLKSAQAKNHLRNVEAWLRKRGDKLE